MFYGIEKVAEIHRQELLREAEQVRQRRLCVGEPISFRRPVGRFLVRIGSRLNEEPRRIPQLANAGDAA
jgi:hypothetical protein